MGSFVAEDIAKVLHSLITLVREVYRLTSHLLKGKAVSFTTCHAMGVAT